MEEVAHDNADVVFTTSIRMRPACLKVAAQHPKTRFLNCCLNAPHPLVRTYYPRTYEANYLLGMLAGILNLTDRVGYVAANPVYGVPAAVNAFARGLRIQVCCVQPGDIRTGFTAAREENPEGDDIYGGRIARSVAGMERDEQNGTGPGEGRRILSRMLRRERESGPSTPSACNTNFSVLPR